MNLKELKTVESKKFSLLEKGLVDPPKEKDIYIYQQVHSNVDFNSKEQTTGAGTDSYAWTSIVH